MKKIISKNKYVVIFILMLSVFSIDIVSAKTVVDFDICEFRSTLQLLKLIGMVIDIVKILLPLLLIFMCIKDALKPIMSGKSEDLTGMVPLFLKRFLAAAMIFFIPTIVNYAVDTLISFDDSSFKECTTCLLDHDNCVIPDEDPDLYEED